MTTSNVAPPQIGSSTCEERLAFVEEQWQCLGHCASCGKCKILKGRDEKEIYAEYIKGTREYIEITKEIRQQ